MDIDGKIAIHLFKQRGVHCKKWDVASKHDKTIFKEELANKIPAGKRVIVDKGMMACLRHTVDTISLILLGPESSRKEPRHGRRPLMVSF